jgi:general secretion pathway protein B
MSYILEALRKADAERERGTVPDLHAQLIPLTAGRVDDEGTPTPMGWWIGIGGAVLLLGLLAWWWFATVGGTAVVVAPSQTAMPTSAAPAPGTVRSIEPAASVPPAAASAAVAVAASAAATPTSAPASSAAAAPAIVPATAIAAAPKLLPKAAPRPTAPAKAPPKALPKALPQAPAADPPGTPAAASPSKAPAPPPEVRVPALAELPEDVRRQVPAMAMGGSVYSPEAARRMVIVNGQVFVEGSTLAPELRLERINPKSAVFSIRGQRFQVPL